MLAATAAVLSVLAACGENVGGTVLGAVSLEPDGTVPACSPVTLRVSLAGLARYSVVADGTPLAAGLLYAGEQRIGLPGLPDPPEGSNQTTLTITAVGSSSRTERRTLQISRSENAAPHANAGPTLRVLAGEPVVLDGSGSRDPDGDPLTFAWSIVDGAAELQGSDSARPTITLSEPGTTEVELLVTDSEGARGTARATVRAIDAGAPPTFVEPSDTVVLTAEPGQSVQIDATANSAGGAGARYRFVQTAGPAVTLDAQGSLATLRAPSSEGLVTIDAVADNGYDSIHKRVSLLVGSDTLEDTPPTPRVVAVETAPVLSEITLDGTTSSDPERSDLGYLWSVEEAPRGSMVSAAGVVDNGTSAADRVVVLLDREGLYRFRLRAVDAVGPSPAFDEAVVIATIDPVVDEVGAVRDVSVDDAGRTFATLLGGGARLVASGAPLYSDSGDAGATVFAGDPGFYWSRQGNGAAEIVLVATTGDELGAQQLPSDAGEDPPSEVRGIAVSPSGDNEGDLFLATNAGFVILDVSDATEELPIGRPLQIGRDFVHRPPSYTPEGLTGAERDAFIAAQQERGGLLTSIGARPSGEVADTIEVVAGNPFWIVDLDYPLSQSFVTRTYDPLGDDEPNAVLALGVGPDTEIVMLESRGVLWRGGTGGSDCFLTPGQSPGCPAPAGDACATGASDAPPADALDVAASSSGRFWIASSDGLRRFDPDTGRFVLLAAAGQGPVSAVDVRAGVVAVGTESGIARIDVGAAE